MRAWDIAPPPQRRHIVRIVELDFDKVFEGIIPANPNLGTLVTDSDDFYIGIMPPGPGSRVSLSHADRFIVYLDDGSVGRANQRQINEAFEHLGQDWPNEEDE